MRKILGALALAGAIVLGTTAVADVGTAARADTGTGSGTGRDVTVRTDAGLLRGAAAPGHRVFQGIPYAAPPVGELRWRAPRPAPAWDGVRDARRPGSRCPQHATPGNPGSTTEDCLYLDVTTPHGARRAPVLVWLHGGGLMNGAGSDHDAHRLATRGGLVVVTVNYRLGNFGFFGHPGLTDPDLGDTAAGVLGIADQQAALRWVRRNAAAFGGDPGNVTVAGESAGSHSVCAHLASPAATGLFQRAIGQSSPCPVGLFDGAPFRPLLDVPYFVPQEWHDGHGREVAAQVGCTDPATAVECLRAAPAEALLRASALPLPAYGNAVLPEDPVGLFAAGRHTRVPFLTGVTRDEGTLFAPYVLPGLTPDNYAATLDGRFGALGPAIAAEYPLADHGGSAVQAAAAVMSDLDWAWPQHEAERLLAERMPTYAYEFLDRTAPPIPDYPPGAEPLASHGAEVAYLFDSTTADSRLTREQRRLGDRMIGYWSRFAAAGDPNGPGLPAWPRVSAGRHHVQGLDLGPRGTGPFDRDTAHRLDFWRSLR